MKLLRLWLKSGLLQIVILFLLVVLAGTLGYALLERWSLLDSLYATIITVTTVGYGDLVQTCQTK